MTTYLARSAWTPTAAGGTELTGTELDGVAVHWPGTTQATIGPASQSAIASRLRSYRTYHVGTRGWADIGYNIAIDQAGRVWMLRTTQWRGNRAGAHAASTSNPRANHKYVGVLLLLGNDETPSPAMTAAFRDWYHRFFLTGWPGRTDVRGHGQVPGASTSCPGPRARAAINDMTRKPSSGPTNPGDDMVAPSDWTTADKDVVNALIESRLNNAIVKHTDKNLAWHIRRLTAGQQANTALLAAIVDRDPNTPLTADEVRRAVHNAIEEGLVKVEVTIEGTQDDE